MRFIIGVVFTVTLIGTSVQGRFDNNILRSKRQSFLCGTTYLSLSSEERDCLPSLDSDSVVPSFSVNLFEKLCSSEICVNTIKKLLKGCKVTLTNNACHMTHVASPALNKISHFNDTLHGQCVCECV